ncbi:dynein beta chain, ciliary-like [Homalodisca vitripennis]|uniref:dynein beta chain, ciliary-like n=1 Tax=Homalodisca vitripennis TaxID=197043 RepID=UPI001EE9B222|nr:dynein beta chain, ciliary-like [Homalodisca vitripennis]
MRLDSKPEEFKLVEEEVLAIDDLIDEAQSLLNWMSPNAWEYIESIRDLVDQLAHRVLRAQKNLVRIITLANTWANIPLFNRKNLDKDNLLALEEAPDKVLKRYMELHQAGLEVCKLVAENFRLYFNVPLRVPPPPPPADEALEDELYEQLLPLPPEEGAPLTPQGMQFLNIKQI